MPLPRLLCDDPLLAMSKRRSSPTLDPAPRPSVEAALTYTSRIGETWYLHEGVTKTGKPRYYVARSPGTGARTEMPAGMEFRESVNSVVSVAKIDPNAATVAPADLALLQAELRRHELLARHTVAAAKGEIVLYEPQGMSAQEMSRMVSIFGLGPSALDGYKGRVRYTPVMKFTPEGRPDQWCVSRWVFRGEGWWHPLGFGTLRSLARQYFPAVGTDAFFELL